jgi:hypothetical protein
MRNPSAFNVNALVEVPRADRPMRLYARSRALAAELGEEFLKAQERRPRKVEKERRRSP